MKTQRDSSVNPYGKSGDFATKQIIDRILGQHFDSSPNRQKSIGEIEDEMLKIIHEKVQVVDFANGENCEFQGTNR
jgi:hypothetical protein